MNAKTSLRGVLWVLRQLKHRGFVLTKHARWRAQALRWAGISLLGRWEEQRGEFSFDPGNYRRSFLVRHAPPDGGESQCPRRVFAVWTGENEMSTARARSVEILRERLGVPLELVTPDTLSRWIVPERPLPPAYQHLSLVHRSDYLRAYLLHHHGGGYVDIKRPVSSWGPVFDAVDRDPTIWLVSYRELSARSAARLPGRLGHDVALQYRRLVGCGGMIARSHTPFTSEWLREVERRVDALQDQAQEFPGGIRGETVGYPFSWTDLLGKIYQPLQLKYLAHVRADDRLLLEFDDYL